MSFREGDPAPSLKRRAAASSAGQVRLIRWHPGRWRKHQAAKKAQTPQRRISSQSAPLSALRTLVLDAPIGPEWPLKNINY